MVASLHVLIGSPRLPRPLANTQRGAGLSVSRGSNVTFVSNSLVSDAELDSTCGDALVYSSGDGILCPTDAVERMMMPFILMSRGITERPCDLQEFTTQSSAVTNSNYTIGRLIKEHEWDELVAWVPSFLCPALLRASSAGGAALFVDNSSSATLRSGAMLRNSSASVSAAVAAELASNPFKSEERNGKKYPSWVRPPVLSQVSEASRTAATGTSFEDIFEQGFISTEMRRLGGSTIYVQAGGVLKYDLAENGSIPAGSYLDLDELNGTLSCAAGMSSYAPHSLITQGSDAMDTLFEVIKNTMLLQHDRYFIPMTDCPDGNALQAARSRMMS